MRTIIILLLFIQTARAQQQPVDSLIKEIPAAKDDTAKARLYKKIAEEYSTFDPKRAMQYAETGLQHVNTMHWNKGIAVFNTLIGTLYSDQGKYDTAIERYNKAYALHLAGKDDYNAANTLSNIGTAYLRQSFFDKAAGKYFEALKLAEKIKNPYLEATCLSNIASVYFNQQNYNKAAEYESRALKIHQSENNDIGIANSYLSIANIYQNKRDTTKAIDHYQMALKEYSKNEHLEGIATVYGNLSLLITDINKKIDYQLKAHALWQNLNPSHTMALTNMGNIAYSYMTLRNPASLNNAKEYLDNGILLSQEANDIGNYSFLTGARSELEAAMNNYKSAYQDLKKFHELNDSIYSQENKNKIAAVEAQREVELRDKEIELNKLALSAQKKQRLALIAGVGLLFIIGVLLYRQNRIRKKLNNELDRSNKIKAKFFAILSHDLRSPIASLIDFLHLQKAEPGLLTEVHQQKVTESAEALLENMETMLLWSKEQMDDFKPNINKVAVQQLFDYLKRSVAGLENINFIANDPQQLSIQTDENYLQVIIYNLTSNALKAVKEVPHPTIEWKAVQENGKVVLSITDNGPGIREEFSNVVHTQHNNRTGLGLHLIRDLAKAINCKITVQAAPGEGTTFYLEV